MAKKVGLIISIFLLSGCTSIPFHTDLMSDQQLIAANCNQLAEEEKKVEQNSQHMAEKSSFGGISSVLFAAFEGYAQSDTKGRYTPSNASNNFSDSSSADAANAAALAKRQSLISTLRIRKRCS